MKIKLRTLVANPDGVFQPGTVVDFPEWSAKQLVDGGFAEALETAPPPKKPKKKKKGE